MKNDLERRKVLQSLAAAGTTSLAGCSSLLGSGAEEIREQANQTSQRLKSELPWNEYSLDYNTESIRVGLQRLGPTGVENASQYRINMRVPLSDNSDDLEGWLATSERRSEFFSLLNDTTYDMFALATEDFNQYEPPQRPSNRNQVIEYRVRVNGDSCSYLQDTVPVEEMDEILSSRSAYADYVDEGRGYDINIEEGFLGTRLFCNL
mgnify:CR=1 FL=1